MKLGIGIYYGIVWAGIFGCIILFSGEPDIADSIMCKNGLTYKCEELKNEIK